MTPSTDGREQPIPQVNWLSFYVGSFQDPYDTYVNKYSKTEWYTEVTWTSATTADKEVTVKAAGLIRNLQAGGVSLLGATASVAACLAAAMF